MLQLVPLGTRNERDSHFRKKNGIKIYHLRGPRSKLVENKMAHAIVRDGVQVSQFGIAPLAEILGLEATQLLGEGQKSCVWFKKRF
jgi:hypothetical protein